MMHNELEVKLLKKIHRDPRYLEYVPVNIKNRFLFKNSLREMIICSIYSNLEGCEIFIQKNGEFLLKIIEIYKFRNSLNIINVDITFKMDTILIGGIDLQWSN